MSAWKISLFTEHNPGIASRAFIKVEKKRLAWCEQNTMNLA